jgi:hypothetical protein
VVEVVGSLPDAQREAFVLQHEAGLSMEDIAEATEVARETGEEQTALHDDETTCRHERMVVNKHDPQADAVHARIARIYRERAVEAAPAPAPELGGTAPIEMLEAEGSSAELH